MSKNKRNVAYIKPEEPAFLKRIKQEIGYKETEDHLEMKVRTRKMFRKFINLKKCIERTDSEH